MGFQEAFDALARDKDLAGQPTRVLLALLAKLDFENWVAVSQVEIAERLGMRRERVSEAFRVLREKGVIEAVVRPGGIRTYRLNNGYAWRGSVTNLQKERAQRLSLAIDNSVRAE